MPQRANPAKSMFVSDYNGESLAPIRGAAPGAPPLLLPGSRAWQRAHPGFLDSPAAAPLYGPWLAGA